MNPRLLGLLVALGTIGGVTVYRLAPGATRAELSAEGVLDGGVRTTIAIEGRRDLGDGGHQYGSGNVDGIWRATDSALIIDPPDAVEVFRPDRARRNDAAGAVTAKTMATRTDDCACSSGANCQWTPPGGVAGPAPLRRTLGDGTWSGAGCVPKTCGTVARQDGADESWPAGCPQ